MSDVDTKQMTQKSPTGATESASGQVMSLVGRMSAQEMVKQMGARLGADSKATANTTHKDAQVHSERFLGKETISNEAKSVMSDNLELIYHPTTEITKRAYDILLGIVQTEAIVTGAVITSDLLYSLADEAISILKQKEDDCDVNKKKQLDSLFGRGLASYHLEKVIFTQLVNAVSQMTDYRDEKDQKEQTTLSTDEPVSVVFEDAD